MQKMRIRIGRLVTPTILFGLGLCLLTILAPGYTWFGSRHVELEYADRLRLHGAYESLWRLRYYQLIVEYESRDDKSRRRNREIPIHRFVSRGPDIESAYPLTLILHGVSYPIGDITPGLIRSLGGQVDQPPFKGDSTGILTVPATQTTGRGSILLRFRDGVPVSFKYMVELSAKPPAGVALSSAGGPMLQLPATEDEVLAALGPPVKRDDRIYFSKAQPPIFITDQPFPPSQ